MSSFSSSCLLCLIQLSFCHFFANSLLKVHLTLQHWFINPQQHIFNIFRLFVIFNSCIICQDHHYYCCFHYLFIITVLHICRPNDTVTIEPQNNIPLKRYTIMFLISIFYVSIVLLSHFTKMLFDNNCCCNE